MHVNEHQPHWVEVIPLFLRSRSIPGVMSELLCLSIQGIAWISFIYHCFLWRIKEKLIQHDYTEVSVSESGNQLEARHSWIYSTNGVQITNILVPCEHSLLWEALNKVMELSP